MVYYKQNGGLYLLRRLYANQNSEKLLKKYQTLHPGLIYDILVRIRTQTIELIEVKSWDLINHSHKEVIRNSRSNLCCGWELAIRVKTIQRDIQYTRFTVLEITDVNSPTSISRYVDDLMFDINKIQLVTCKIVMKIRYL